MTRTYWTAYERLIELRSALLREADALGELARSQETFPGMTPFTTGYAEAMGHAETRIRAILKEDSE